MFKESVDLLKDYENIYMDISAWQSLSDQQIAEQLAYIDEKTGSLDRIMFGTDAPNFTPMISTKNWINRIQSLALPKDVMEKLLGETAAKVHNV